MGNKILSILSPLCTLQINWEHKTAGRDDDVGLVMKWKINRSRRRKVVRQQNTNTQSRDGSLKDWICAEAMFECIGYVLGRTKKLYSHNRNHTHKHTLHLQWRRPNYIIITWNLISVFSLIFLIVLLLLSLRRLARGSFTPRRHRCVLAGWLAGTFMTYINLFNYEPDDDDEREWTARLGGGGGRCRVFDEWKCANEREMDDGASPR